MHSEINSYLCNFQAASRLFRFTGSGIYADSLSVGAPVPSWATHPLINSGVIGQDSVQATRHGDDIFWFFGDTNRIDYPLGKP